MPLAKANACVRHVVPVVNGQGAQHSAAVDIHMQRSGNEVHAHMYGCRHVQPMAVRIVLLPPLLSAPAAPSAPTLVPRRRRLPPPLSSLPTAAARHHGGSEGGH